MVEDDQNFVAAVHLVAYVDVVVLLGLAGVAGLAAVDQRDAFGVGRDRKGDRVVLVALTHRDRRHNYHFMAVYKAGLVCLGAGDVYAVRSALDNVQEQVGVGLLGRSQRTVALNVGH